MEKNNKKEIDFVLRYYSEGKIDTQRAISLFKVRTGRTCRRSTWGISAVAATVITLIIAGAFMLFHQKQTVLTAENAVQTFILPDSTKVTLSPHSSLQYSENDCRTVVMTGKIYFEVHHDPEKSFRITGDMGQVEVLGTKFEIAETLDAATVFVTNGKVIFSSKNSHNGIILTQGMRATLGKGSDKPRIMANGNINHLAWATHKFYFHNASMRQVLDDLELYYGVKLSANDYNKRLTADFNTDNIDYIIDLIEHIARGNIETIGI